MADEVAHVSSKDNEHTHTHDNEQKSSRCALITANGNGVKESEYSLIIIVSGRDVSSIGVRGMRAQEGERKHLLSVARVRSDVITSQSIVAKTGL